MHLWTRTALRAKRKTLLAGLNARWASGLGMKRPRPKVLWNQLKGKTQNAVGKVKDAARDAADKVKSDRPEDNIDRENIDKKEDAA